MITLSAFGFESRIQFEHLTTDDGLSNMNVRCVMQDNQGFMWLGTFDGLDKYDGYNFKVYRYSYDDSTSIPSNTIQCIYNDSQGCLWIGTTRGLCLYNRSGDNFTRFKSYNAFRVTI